MKVLLVYTNTYDFLSPPPIGISLMTKPLENAGHEVTVVDFMKVEDTDALLETEIKKHRPDIIGFSLRNFDNQKFPDTLDFVPDFVRWLKIANKYAPTIVGGSAFMSMPEKMFTHLGAAYGMVGQGDRAFPMFLEELKNKTSGFKSPGVMWRENGQILCNEGILDGYPENGSIDWSFVDLKRYKKPYMNGCVISKTGCPHQCLFCDAGTSFGSRFVTRKPEVIMEDLYRDAKEYAFHKTDYFFIDAIFNEPLSWAKKVLEAIIRSELKLCIYLLIEPTNIDREFAQLLKKAGCVMVTSLLNSMDDTILEKMKRPFTVEKINRAYKLFEQEGICYMPQFLLGGPGETRETIEKTISSLKHWKPIMVDACYGIRILPKAGLRKVALDEGVITEDTDLLKPTFYLSEALKNDREWLDKQIKSMNRFRIHSLFQWPRVIMRSITVKNQK